MNRQDNRGLERANLGVGIAYNAKIMAVKAGQYSGILTSADIAGDYFTQ